MGETPVDTSPPPHIVTTPPVSSQVHGTLKAALHKTKTKPSSIVNTFKNKWRLSNGSTADLPSTNSSSVDPAGNQPHQPAGPKAKSLSLHDRMHRVKKELFVSLGYLQDVSEKGKFEMISGSASVVLDTLFKLLMLLTEATISSSKNPDFLSAYNQVYRALARLLRWCDQKVIHGIEDESMPSLSALCCDMRTSVASLLELTFDHLSHGGSTTPRGSGAGCKDYNANKLAPKLSFNSSCEPSPRFGANRVRASIPNIMEPVAPRRKDNIEDKRSTMSSSSRSSEPDLEKLNKLKPQPPPAFTFPRAIEAPDQPPPLPPRRHQNPPSMDDSGILSSSHCSSRSNSYYQPDPLPSHRPKSAEDSAIVLFDESTTSLISNGGEPLAIENKRGSSSTDSETLPDAIDCPSSSELVHYYHRKPQSPVTDPPGADIQEIQNYPAPSQTHGDHSLDDIIAKLNLASPNPQLVASHPDDDSGADRETVGSTQSFFSAPQSSDNSANQSPVPRRPQSGGFTELSNYSPGPMEKLRSPVSLSCISSAQPDQSTNWQVSISPRSGEPYVGQDPTGDEHQVVETTEEIIDGKRVRRKLVKTRKIVTKVTSTSSLVTFGPDGTVKRTVVESPTSSGNPSIDDLSFVTSGNSTPTVWESLSSLSSPTSPLPSSIPPSPIKMSTATTPSGGGGQSGIFRAVPAAPFIPPRGAYLPAPPVPPRPHRKSSSSRASAESQSVTTPSVEAAEVSRLLTPDQVLEKGYSYKPDSSSPVRTFTTTSTKLERRSNARQMVSKQMLIDGKVVYKIEESKWDGKKLSAAKEETWANGSLTGRKGSGSYTESTYERKNSFGKDGASLDKDRPVRNHSIGAVVSASTTNTPPPIPPKKKQSVVTYMQLVGTLPSSADSTPPSDFQSSALASYALLSDRWSRHEESLKQKSFSFSFDSSSSTALPPISSTTGSGSVHLGNGIEGPPMTDYVVVRKDMPVGAPAVSTRRSSEEYYNNLMDLLKQTERIRFPQPIIEEVNDDGDVVVDDSERDEPGEDRSPTTPRLPPSVQLRALPPVNFLEELDVSKHVMFHKTIDCDSEVRGAPADVLVVYATKPCTTKADFKYQECFLMTYRTFVEPLALLQKLIERYKIFSRVGDVTSRRASRNAFSLLIRIVDDLSPMETTADVINTLMEFAYSMITEGELNLPRLLRMKLLEKVEDKRAAESQQIHSPKLPRHPPSNNTKNSATLLDFKASDIAAQLTYLDCQYFQRVELCEMLWWSQEQVEEKSPNLVIFTEHFNNMSYWVRSRILTENDPKDREKIMAKFIKVMKYLRKMGNFNSYLAVLSALNSSCILRLEWAKTFVEELKDHCALIDNSKSFKAYRLALAETKPPCLPYLGVILTDLTFVHIGNPNLLKQEKAGGRYDIINFSKRQQQYTILDNVRRFKAWSYQIKKNQKIMDYFRKFDDRLTEEECWTVSEQLKPRGSGHRPAYL